MEPRDIPIIPFLGGKGTLRDVLLEIISQHHGLHAKEIHRKVNRMNRKEVTYQAVHKMLLDLTKQGVISKENSTYTINPDWVGQLSQFSKQLQHNVSGEVDIVMELKNVDKNPVRITFTDLTELCLTVARIGAEKLLEKKSIPYYTIVNHGWWPTRFSFTDFLLLRKMNQNYPKSMGIILSNTPFDKWLMRQYQLTDEKTGGYTIVDASAGPIDEDVIALGEYVIRAKFSSETTRHLDKNYREMHGLYDMLNKYWIHPEEKFQPHVELIIERNPTLSKLIQEKVEKHMKKSKAYREFIQKLTN